MSPKGYDPIELTRITEKIVVKDNLRKYYRIARPGRWYGGICAADCVGCNLRCVFCWSNYPRDKPDKAGKFYSPIEVYTSLRNCALKYSYDKIRISGNEPTIGRRHLLEVLDLVESDGELYFILETNGILIGYDKSYAKDLSKYTKLHVRVSIKGCSEKEFRKLTGAKPEAYKLQLNALKNLLDYNVSFHPAVMVSFCSKDSLRKLIERLAEIDPRLPSVLEPEYVILYPHVVERLRKAGLKPNISYNP